MKIQVIKTNGVLKFAHNSDYELSKKIPENKIFEIEYKKQRNLKFHKKFFALIKLAFENQELYTNIDDFRHDLLVLSHFYDEKINLFTNEKIKVAKSLKFSQMDEVEFSEVYENVKNTICKLLRVTNEIIEQEVEQYF